VAVPLTRTRSTSCSLGSSIAIGNSSKAVRPRRRSSSRQSPTQCGH
jgi:hypothetical protein